MPTRSTALRCCVALAAFGVLTAAAQAAPKPNDLRKQLTPTFHAIQTSPEFIALKAEMDAKPGDEEVMDRILRWLPMSPKEIMEINMQVNRFEHMIPKFVVQNHERWVRLHPETARAHYGQEVVDKITRRLTPYASGSVTPSPSVKGGGGPMVGPNRNAAAGFAPNAPDDYQGEIQLLVNPNNANQVVAGANTFDNGNQSIFFSSDGGDTWGHVFPPNVAAFGTACPVSAPNEFGSDPAFAWDNDDNVYFEYLGICSDGLFTTLFSVLVAESTDGGATWAAKGTVANAFVSGTSEDKQFIYADIFAGSPFEDRLYTCWHRSNDAQSAWSSDSGATWNEVDVPAAPAGGNINIGCEIAIEDNGTVHQVFHSLTCGGGAGSCVEDRIFYTRSTDGGLTWSAPVQVQSMNLVNFGADVSPPAQDNRNITTFGALAIDNSGGPCDGTLYATFSDFAPAGEDSLDTDVWLVRSTDGGTTWLPRIKVNDDGLADRTQFHPFMRVDRVSGNVYIGWHDTRNDPDAEEVEYFLTRSTDCGVSVEANILASLPSAEFNNDAIGFSNNNTTTNPNRNPNQYGEYLGLDVLNDTVYFAWSDTRHYFPGSTTESEADNMGFAKITFGPQGPLFADGFESGDTSAWPQTNP